METFASVPAVEGSQAQTWSDFPHLSVQTPWFPCFFSWLEIPSRCWQFASSNLQHTPLSWTQDHISIINLLSLLSTENIQIHSTLSPALSLVSPKAMPSFPLFRPRTLESSLPPLPTPPHPICQHISSVLPSKYFPCVTTSCHWYPHHPGTSHHHLLPKNCNRLLAGHPTLLSFPPLPWQHGEMKMILLGCRLRLYHHLLNSLQWLPMSLKVKAEVFTMALKTFQYLFPILFPTT